MAWYQEGRRGAGSNTGIFLFNLGIGNSGVYVVKMLLFSAVPAASQSLSRHGIFSEFPSLEVDTHLSPENLCAQSFISLFLRVFCYFFHSTREEGQDLAGCFEVYY